MPAGPGQRGHDCCPSPVKRDRLDCRRDNRLDDSRLECSPGGTCIHWKAPPLHGARHQQRFSGLLVYQRRPSRIPSGLGGSRKTRRQPFELYSFCSPAQSRAALLIGGRPICHCSSGVRPARHAGPVGRRGVRSIIGPVTIVPGRERIGQHQHDLFDIETFADQDRSICRSWGNARCRYPGCT
jgi:hypothetical protein